MGVASLADLPPRPYSARANRVAAAQTQLAHTSATWPLAESITPLGNRTGRGAEAGLRRVLHQPRCWLPERPERCSKLLHEPGLKACSARNAATAAPSVAGPEWRWRRTTGLIGDAAGPGAGRHRSKCGRFGRQRAGPRPVIRVGHPQINDFAYSALTERRMRGKLWRLARRVSRAYDLRLFEFAFAMDERCEAGVLHRRLHRIAG